MINYIYLLIVRLMSSRERSRKGLFSWESTSELMYGKLQSMDLTDKVKALQAYPLFRQLSTSQIEEIARITREQVIPTATALIEQDDLSSFAYFILSGGVQVYRITEDGKKVTLAILGPGEVVGEMSLIDNEPRSACVQTIHETRVLVIDKGEFTRILRAHPNIAMSLLQIMSGRVKAVNEKLEDVLSKNLTERTWKTLKTLTKYFSDGEITLSQEELANIIGATRARVTETLNKLQNEGQITLAHRKIHIV